MLHNASRFLMTFSRNGIIFLHSLKIGFLKNAYHQPISIIKKDRIKTNCFHFHTNTIVYLLFHNTWFLWPRVDYIALVYFILLFWNKYTAPNLIQNEMQQWNTVGFQMVFLNHLNCGFTICEVILLTKKSDFK